MTCKNTENWNVDCFHVWQGYIFVGLKLVVFFKIECFVKNVDDATLGKEQLNQGLVVMIGSALSVQSVVSVHQ